MPQNTWTNKDLDRFRTRPSQPQDMEVLSETKRTPEAVPPYQAEPSVEALLAQARGTLSRANETERQFGLERGQREGGGYGPLPLSKTDIAKGAFELLNPLGGGFDLGDQASDAEQFAASSLPFLTSGGVGAVKSLGQLAVRGAKAAPAAIARGWDKFTTPSRMAGQFPRVMGAPASQEVAGYAGRQMATNPNQALEIARDIAAESGDDLGAVLRQGAKGGVGRASAQALERLAGSGAEGRGAMAVRDAQAAAARQAPYTRAGVPQKAGVDPYDFMGDRTTGSFVEGPGGLSDIAAGRFQRMPAPENVRYMSEVDNLVGGLDDTPFDLVDDAADVLQVQPNARDVDMLAAGVNPQQQAAQASTYARDTMKRKTPPPPKNPKPRGKSKSASLRALQKTALPLADDLVNAGYQAAKE